MASKSLRSNPMIAAVALFLFSSRSSPSLPMGPATRQFELSAKARPQIELAITKGLPVVTANEYLFQNERPALTFTVRVYRFTKKANYWDEEGRWLKQFTKKDGWEVQNGPNSELVLRRLVKDEKITEQTLRLHTGTIARGVGVGADTRVLTAPSYIWFSLVERLREPTSKMPQRRSSAI